MDMTMQDKRMISNLGRAEEYIKETLRRNAHDPSVQYLRKKEKTVQVYLDDGHSRAEAEEMAARAVLGLPFRGK